MHISRLFQLLAAGSTVLFMTNGVSAQGLGSRIKENAKWKTENKAGEKVDRGIDNVLDGNIFRKKDKGTAGSKSADNDAGGEAGSVTSKASSGGNEPASFKAYSKFDFLPGEKVLYYDDFERVAVGDFPADYNTDASAEVKTVDRMPGKWLSMTQNGSFIAEKMGALPDQFTLEMNVGLLGEPTNNNSGFGLHFNTDPSQLMDYHFGRGSFVTLHGGGASAKFSIWQPSTEQYMANDIRMPQWNVGDGKNFARVSLWRQGSRLRVYVNENKLMDLPRFFNEAKPYHLAFYRNFFGDCDMMITDIRLAVGQPDTRSKLETEGRFSTTGILFDFQKATIRPESYAVIKQVADMLRESGGLKVKIVGHTSNDGDPNANLQLSRQRAAAVREVLMKEFGIDGGRMETDGKGGSEPADKSGTPEGKANNRRVEFIKI